MHDNDGTRTPVTVIGLGLMGRAIAATALRDGHPTTVWNRTAEKATELVARGARLAETAGDAVAASPLVIVCVTDYDAVREILEPLGGSMDGRVLVNLTSGTSEVARETAGWVARQGGVCLDGAIMASPPAIGTADAAILYSGPRPIFDQYEATLGSVGAAIHLGEDHGLSSLHEVAVLGLMWGILNGFVQGAAVLGAAGVKAAAFAPLAIRGIETVTGWLPGYARQIDDGAYPGDDSTIDIHLAAMAHVVHESEALGVNVELSRLTKTLADRAVADGHGGSSYAAMIEQFRKVTART
ncbi:3-hydroxyisobutyrate dehydrogenase [Micromonospora phaseoli]|uniref:3-hydroxyisobutyrate dehydrogenase n=1 Tax=Micromonospora phaseoli TaxID=1144548 RepID=A0A1H7E2L7_9ACTN|nr:NAD(P)-binding domain-containing protein [Micromonospora phaseoli]PZV99186.1 3-hydroxyisobutyrate dehydrogenase-like beta-hydroxyacid dehydrogenase [Micromonospora phaseoli]GIJ80018.1 3-hydroxyisobutyrate dehydrogenase [Micromonospora phaseoli]SEK04805.1 3-hydroxyisobutyrate dehydrogenase [Micromonospora phaseoli]